MVLGCWHPSPLCKPWQATERQHSLAYSGGHPRQTATGAAARPERVPWKTAPFEGCVSLSRSHLAQGGSVDAPGDLRQPWDTEMPG